MADARLKIEYRSVESLIPYARNPRVNDPVVNLMASGIKEFGFRYPILIKSDGTIVDGHLRVKAALKLKLKEIPTVCADDMTPAQIKAFRIYVNRVPELVEWDREMLGLELEELKDMDFDLEMTGFGEDDLNSLIMNEADGEPENDNTYTNKIVAPIYEPKGKCPPISELIDRSKTESLITEINKSKIPDDIAEFLRLSAERHTVFHFGHIAEYYCHAKPEVQDLMEKSGMVIIDFKKAIEYGFVHLTERLGELADLEEADNADA